MKPIPSKDRKEWRDLLTGQINVPLKNFFFQMKVTQAKKQVEKGKITIEYAVDEIYNLCVKFSEAKYMDVDIQNIFGSAMLVNEENAQGETSKIQDIEKNTLVIEEKKLIDTKEKEKQERLNIIRMKEEEAKRQRELDSEKQLGLVEKSAKSDKLEQIRLEAQRIIQQRYEMELAKRKMEQKQEQLSQQKPKISQNQVSANNVQKTTQREAEKKRIQQRKKRKVVEPKKNGLGSVVKGWFINRN